MYENHYLAFPMAYQHLPAPPVWLDDNDGFHDVRIMHSAGGVHWRYVGGDRSAFMSRGPSGGAAVFSVDASPDDRDPRTWRESMVAAVRGLVIDDNQTMTMFACEYSSSRVDAFLKRLKERLRTDGARLREGSAQPNSDGVPDGSFVRLTMRRDGWSSIGPVSSKWTQPGSFTTLPLVFEGTRLLLNAQTSNVSLATVCLSHLTTRLANADRCCQQGGEVRAGIEVLGGGQATAFTLDNSVPLQGDQFSHEMAWTSANSSSADIATLSGHIVRLHFELRSARIFSFRFDAPISAADRRPLKSDDRSDVPRLLDVQTDLASGAFTLMLAGSAIAEGSAAGLRHKATVAASGTDALGRWRGARTEWVGDGRVPLATVAKSYDSGDIVAFEQQWPAGYRPRPGVTQKDTAPSAAFPSFAPCKAHPCLLELPFVSFESFSPTWGAGITSSSQAKVFGAYRAGPVVLMANSTDALPNAIVISPTDHFHVASAVSNSGRWDWGIAASVALPPGTNHTTVLVAGRGPTQAMDRWGRGVIRHLAGTDRSEAKASDAAMTHIGCKIEMLSQFVALPVSLTQTHRYCRFCRQRRLLQHEQNDRQPQLRLQGAQGAIHAWPKWRAIRRGAPAGRNLRPARGRRGGEVLAAGRLVL